MKLKYNSLHDFNNNLDNKPYLAWGKLYKLVISGECHNCAFYSLDKKYCLVYHNLGLSPFDVCIKKNIGAKDTSYIYKLIK